MSTSRIKTLICFVFAFLFVTSCIIQDTKDFYYIDLLKLNLCVVNLDPEHHRIYLYKTRLNKDKDYIDIPYSLCQRPDISLHFSADTPNVVCVEDRHNFVKKVKSGDFHIRVSKIIEGSYERSDSTFLKIPCQTIKFYAHNDRMVMKFYYPDTHYKKFFYTEIYPTYRELNGLWVIFPPTD